MASQFDFSVSMTGRNRNRGPETLPFSTDEEPISMAELKKFPCFKENYSVSLNFHVDASNRDWKLFILGINSIAYQINNAIPNPYYHEGSDADGGSCQYYLPVGYHTLYDSTSQSKAFVAENKPITPNVYTVKVTDGEHWYYSHFVIAPKNFTFKQWGYMVNEIGQLSHKLNANNSQQQAGFVSKNVYSLSVPFAESLIKLAPRIRIALHFILQSFRFDTRKHYRWVRRGKEHEVDARTVQMASRFPASIGMIYAPYRYSDYNTGDNRWVKFITTRMLKWANQALESFDDKILADRPQLLKLRNYLSYALNESLLNGVDTYPPRFITKGLIYSPRYNQYFQLYQRLLTNRQHKLTVAPNQYRFKRTDKLYEFWIFIKVVQSLQYYGYQSVSGWGCGTDDDKWLLEPNTRVLLKKGDMYLRVVYDDDMGGVANRYDEPIMMFGTTHQRPDLRIDIFYQNHWYWGSLILDAKYKDLGHIIANASFNGQLTDYANKAFSRFNNKLWISPNKRTVIRVLAVYPGSNSKSTRHMYHDSLFRLRQLGVNMERLVPDNEMCLYEFANDLRAQLKPRIDGMMKNVKLRKIEKAQED